MTRTWNGHEKWNVWWSDVWLKSINFIFGYMVGAACSPSLESSDIFSLIHSGIDLKLLIYLLMLCGLKRKVAFVWDNNNSTELVTFLQDVKSRECATHLTKTGSTDKDPLVVDKQCSKPAPTSERKWKKANVPFAVALNTGSSSISPCLFWESPSHKSPLCKANNVTMRVKKLKKIG